MPSRRSSISKMKQDRKKKEEYEFKKEDYKKDDYDIEKGKPRPQKDSVSPVLTVVLTLLVGATFINLLFFKSTYSESLNEPPSTWRHALFKMLQLEHSTGPSSTDYNLFDINAISAKYMESDESWKLDDHNRLLHQYEDEVHDNYNYNEPIEDDVKPQNDLKEILSISPITVILTDDEESEAEGKFLEILLMSLTITPEPKVVNLRKHPHFQQVLEYLESYSSHEHNAEPTSTTEERIKFLNEDATIDPDFLEPVGDIPRLFIGGRPVAGFDEVIELHQKGELVTFLSEKGKGLISIV